MKSQFRSFTLLMKHVDPFYRFGFDNAISDHVHQKKRVTERRKVVFNQRVNEGHFN